MDLSIGWLWVQVTLLSRNTNGKDVACSSHWAFLHLKIVGSGVVFFPFPVQGCFFLSYVEWLGAQWEMEISLAVCPLCSCCVVSQALRFVVLVHMHNCLKELKLLWEHLRWSFLKESAIPSRLTGLTGLSFCLERLLLNLTSTILVAVVVEIVNYSWLWASNSKLPVSSVFDLSNGAMRC